MTKGKASHAIEGSRVHSHDAQVAEFETRDLGTDIRKSGTLHILRRPRALPTSIVLDPGLISKLRAKGTRRGIGYQTMLKIIVAEHVDEY